MADGVSRSAGTVMQTGSRVGLGDAALVCSNRVWASAAVGRMSSFACAAMAGFRNYQLKTRSQIAGDVD